MSETGMKEERDRWEGTLYFHPDDAIYREHFCGCPVVPGSLIVHAFLEALEGAGFPIKCRAIEQWTFREFLSPGRYPFRIERCGENVHCRIYRGDKTLVRGILKP